MTPCEHKTPFVGCEWCYRIVPDPRDEEIRELREKNEKLREGLEGEELSEAGSAECMADFTALRLEIDTEDRVSAKELAVVLRRVIAASRFQRDRAEKSEAQMRELRRGLQQVANVRDVETLVIADNVYLGGEVIRLRELLPNIVDVVWGEAHEDESVPSSDWAQRMIEQAEKRL